MNRLCAAVVVAFACVGAHASASTPVATPDWRDQIVYFVMTDRFDDGDPRNDDQHAGEFDPADGAHYSGGDLAGITRRLDYIHGLGATAVWITPPVANQWWSTRANYGGYHGYWAEDFSRLDAHVGTLADYRALADGLHARGMYLVQDIVVNHVGDYFRYGADPGGDPARGYASVADARGRTAPTQWPFNLNDPRRARDRAASVYHWTRDIRDFADPVQVETGQLAGLDDLNTGRPIVRSALRRAYAQWIRDVGVDAFRVDTAFYVAPAFFDDFLRSDDPSAPGILRVAAAAGKPAFHVFGEGFGLDRAFDDTQARRIESYVRDGAGRPLLPGMLNFPLYGTSLDVFARGRPTAEFADHVERMMRVHSAPHLMPTFVDNHDVDRFLATGNAAGLRQALLALMTLPGIPVIYYGTEQGFAVPRASMFAGGFGSGGRDHFDVASDGYRRLQSAIALRRSHRVFSRGMPTVLASNAGGPGVLAWRTDGTDGAALVVLNTADRPTLLEGLPAVRGRLRPLYAIDGDAPAWNPNDALVLPPRAGYVWSIGAGGAADGAAAARPTLDPLPARVGDRLDVHGRGRPGAVLRIVVDGDLGAASGATVAGDGRWHAQRTTDDFIDSALMHRVVAYDPGTGAVSAPASFRVDRTWTRLADVADPAGDDTGPTGRYTYPVDAQGGRDTHPGDLRRVRAEASGGALRLSIALRDMTQAWNPANGFDHVALTIYIELPGHTDGIAALPLQHAVLPAGMRWQRRLRVGGWSNLLTAPDGADAGHEGVPVTPGASLSVDAAHATLHIALPASALGHPGTLRGARVYVTTWDYDGGYRPLAREPGANAFGGGDANDPRVLDDLLLRLGK